MFIVGKSFFSETLSKLNIKTIAPLCVIRIPPDVLLGSTNYNIQETNCFKSSSKPAGEKLCHYYGQKKIIFWIFRVFA